jgi:hypothetical protein
MKMILRSIAKLEDFKFSVRIRNITGLVDATPTIEECRFFNLHYVKMHYG